MGSDKKHRVMMPCKKKPLHFHIISIIQILNKEDTRSITT